MSLNILTFFFLFLMLSKVEDCRKNTIKSRAGFLPGSPTRPSAKPAVEGGFPIKSNIGGCTSDLLTVGFKTFINEEGEETCVCPSGSGYAKVKNQAHCFACQDSNQRIEASRCNCIKPQNSAVTVTLTPEGKCKTSSVGPSGLAHIRGEQRGHKPSVPRSSYAQVLEVASPPPSHESCRNVENTHLCHAGPRLESFACFNILEEEKHCGDCKNDCNSIPNVEGVSCHQGKCVIASCKSGFIISASQISSDSNEKSLPECTPA